MLNKANSVRFIDTFQKVGCYFSRLASEKSFRNLNFRFLILFACVCIGTLAEFCSLHVLSQSKYPIKFIFIYFIVSFFTSPIQTGYSDNDRRKFILLVALLACSFGLVFSFFLNGPVSNLSAVILIIVVGGLGNLIETAWAAMGDERVGSKNARSVFAISNSFMAIAALLFSSVRLYKLRFLAYVSAPHKLVVESFSYAYLLYGVLGLVLSGLIYWKYEDRHDKDPISPKAANENPFSLIVRIINHLKKLIDSKRFLYGILVFLLWEVAFYLIHQIGIDLKIKPFNFVTRWMAGGYIFGTLLLPFFQKTSGKDLIRIGHYISIFSLIIGLILSLSSTIPLYLLVNLCFAVFAVGAAFLSPTLFSSISAKVPIHMQGILFGSYGSTDTLATALAWILGELLRNLIIHLYNRFKLHFISPVVMISLSLLLMIGAALFYGRFNKIRKH